MPRVLAGISGRSVAELGREFEDGGQTIVTGQNYVHAAPGIFGGELLIASGRTLLTLPLRQILLW